MNKYEKIKTVLIVEDDPSIQVALKSYLESMGLQSTLASDGEQAIRIFNQSAFDLLITDFRLPKMDGVELLNWCRRHHIHIPVIFMSANAHLIEREQVALADCCATLMFKPLNLKVLTAAIGAADSRSHHKDCIHFRDNPVE